MSHQVLCVDGHGPFMIEAEQATHAGASAPARPPEPPCAFPATGGSSTAEAVLEDLPAELLEWRVARVLDQFEISTRLYNVLGAEPLASLTLGEFIRDRERFDQAVRGQWALGKKTFEEISAGLEMFLAACLSVLAGRGDVPAQQASGQIAHAEDLAGRAMAAIMAAAHTNNGPSSGSARPTVAHLADILRPKTPHPGIAAPLIPTRPLPRLPPEILALPLADIASSLDIRPSLARLAEATRNPGLTFGDFLSARDKVDRAILAQPKAGRRSLLALTQAIEPFAVACFEVAAQHPALPETGVEGFLRRALLAMLGVPPDAGGTGAVQAAELLGLLASLPERERRVLCENYGLDGDRPRSFSEIAASMGISSARVQQIKQQAADRLGTRAHLVAFEDYLGAREDVIWSVLAAGSPVIRLDELVATRQALSPLALMAMDVANGGLHGGVADWIASRATRTEAGWVKPTYLAKWGEAARRLEAFLSERLNPLPLPTVTSGTGLSAGDLSYAAPLIAQCSVHDGCVVAGGRDGLPAQAARIHAIAADLARSGLVDLASVLKVYRTLHPEERLTARSVKARMDENSHLFAPVLENIWLVLPTTQQHPAPLESLPFETTAVEPDAFEAGSVRDWLVRTLKGHGPARAIDLDRRYQAEFGASLGEGSVLSAYLGNPCFQRAAPGVFSIYDGRDALFPDGTALPSLFSARQCRIYCLAKASGAPVTYYPAWGPDFEMELAAWASRNTAEDPTDHGAAALFRSLLTVIEPETWPASAAVRSHWQDLRASVGRWDIQAERQPALGRRFASAEHFFSALTHLCILGWTSWIAVNRTTRATILAHDAADILALMVAGKLVHPGRHWQERHTATARARRLFVSLCDELHRYGALNWNKGPLGRFKAELDVANSSKPIGWLDPADFKGALDAWNAGAARDGVAFVPRA